MNLTRILVIQLRDLGDCLLSTPVLRQLARLHPQSEIDVLCQSGNECIFRNNPYLNSIVLLPRRSARHFGKTAATLRRRRYDLVLDCQSLPKTAVLAFLSGAPRRLGFHRRFPRCWPLYTGKLPSFQQYVARQRLALLDDSRVDPNDIALDFAVSEPERQTAAEFCQSWFRPPVAALYGVGKVAERLWSPTKVAEVGDRLAERGFQPFLVYGPGEYDAAKTIADGMRHRALLDYPLLTFPVFKEVVSQCTLFVGSDGGPRHVAVAANVPSVIVHRSAAAANNWAPPNRGDMRCVVAGKQMRDDLFGSCVNAATVGDIPVEAVWEEIETLFLDGHLQPPATHRHAG